MVRHPTFLNAALAVSLILAPVLAPVLARAAAGDNFARPVECSNADGKAVLTPKAGVTPNEYAYALTLDPKLSVENLPAVEGQYIPFSESLSADADVLHVVGCGTCEFTITFPQGVLSDHAAPAEFPATIDVFYSDVDQAENHSDVRCHFVD